MRTLDQRLSWLAGIVDGEGSISVAGRRGVPTPRLQLAIYNTTEALIQEVCSILDSVGVHHYVYREPAGRRGNHKANYTVLVQNSTYVPRLLELLKSALVANNLMRSWLFGLLIVGLRLLLVVQEIGHQWQ